jgi:hypothetical protein
MGSGGLPNLHRFLDPALGGGSGQYHAQAAVLPGKYTGTH